MSCLKHAGPRANRTSLIQPPHGGSPKRARTRIITLFRHPSGVHYALSYSTSSLPTSTVTFLFFHGHKISMPQRPAFHVVSSTPSHHKFLCQVSRFCVRSADSPVEAQLPHAKLQQVFSNPSFILCHSWFSNLYNSASSKTFPLVRCRYSRLTIISSPQADSRLRCCHVTQDPLTLYIMNCLLSRYSDILRRVVQCVYGLLFTFCGLRNETKSISSASTPCLASSQRRLIGQCTVFDA